MNWRFLGKEERDEKCPRKDEATLPLLETHVAGSNPAAYHAILMPCTSGPELEVLRRNGVPGGNVWAIECHRGTYLKMQNLSKDSSHPMFGVRLTSKPKRTDDALREIESWGAQEGHGFDLIYLDYLSQPSVELFSCLVTIFRLRMLANGALLVITCGLNRTSPFVARLNESLGHGHDIVVPTRQFVNAALRKANEYAVADAAGRARPPAHPTYRYEARQYRGLSRPGGSAPEFLVSAFWF